MRVYTQWGRFGPSFLCMQCDSQLSDRDKNGVITHPTHIRKWGTIKPIACQYVGVSVKDPFVDIELERRL